MATHRLIQIFLPLYDNDGHPFPQTSYKNLQVVLTEKFNGVTVYQRAPAKGLWKEDRENIVRDDLVIYEVVTAGLDHSFWTDLKEQLLKEYRQQEIMIRSTPVELL
ncbi:hypothetical protein [Dawidia soli]|uniref:Uncharacterized protein n=1 Tax=Dawidia soli TaxID=2782352 RepID=A0AAP2GEE0_9BACT|nr:hypothetical protein [Dawidia soli]MBT1688279.1 hypothetical protein [Dawidia soli]